MHSISTNCCALTKPLVLVGLMGVGKTTIGRRLAARFNIPFVDADHEIEVAAGLTIAEIFERYGEAYFRDGESRVIARLLDGTVKVIATGGGAFMHTATRQRILQSATAIWIDAEINVLAERVSRRETRPLLKNGRVHEVLRELAAVRNPVYALAPIHIKSQPVHQDVVVDKIIEALNTCP